MDILQSQNIGGDDRPRPFIIIAIWAGFVLARIAEVPLQGLKSAEVFVLCIRARVSELLAHDEWGRSSFPSEKAFSASRK